ncbi:MAG: phosphatidate cytidylyltransferase [Rhodobacteraceae bacterium]|nr:phosphatidate cytidylyltransferase [Paracoccaceae bacterium]
MNKAAKWEDLGPRAASGVGLAIVGLGLIWAGGMALTALVAVAAGLMIWELVRLVAKDREREAIILGAISGLLLGLILMNRVADPLLFPLLGLPALAAMVRARQDRLIAGCYAMAIMVAAYGAAAFRGGYGLTFFLWLVLVVISSDLLGYFGGRIFGGPKFWPAISPKKTWSGTLAGWVGAAIVGAVFTLVFGAPAWLAAFSVVVAFAAQMGDIAESAIKRRSGVKDSSAILPGHGGLLDRFDGMIGAIVFVILWGIALPVPAIGG